MFLYISFCSTECRYLACTNVMDDTKACSTCLTSTASYFRRKFQECKREIEELRESDL